MLASAGDGGLCVFWHLSGDDLIPVAAGFARDGPKPVPVLRLRRLHAGEPTLVQEVTLQLRGPSGHGEQVFSVDARPARYDAELGLSDAAGGWVMLARSNVLDHGARVDVRFSTVERIGAPSDRLIEAPAPAATRRTDPPKSGSAATSSSTAREPLGARSVVPEQTGIRAVDVLARRGERLDLGTVRVSDPVPDREPRPAAEIPEQLDRSGQSPNRHPDSAEAPPSRDAVSAAQSDVAMPQPAHAAERRSSPSPTAPMRYGQPTPGAAELLIEAELRVNGCAAPGSLIDLFGHPYRVGPGGRFQLVIRVDDPELIRRAFERNPPDLPDRPGDA
ncbi:MAG: hypothetical protein KFB96_03450 [Thiocapsa sp.]|uniref:hypothetical protein n=1 Tax=Thiocapsa sp. TaxID=2024551 RepID=UPI001BD07997|nr:hypothetical protein [Thiocapsa sp.]QVL49575.1 MAG: hypothetical protein KFB96_03450 [Thiocapsa sp.]